jgi:hypothetical protein
MKTHVKLVAALCLATAVFLGCKKEVTEDMNTQTVMDNKIVGDDFNNFTDAINEKGIKDPIVKGCGNCGLTSGKLSGILLGEVETEFYNIPADGNDTIGVKRQPIIVNQAVTGFILTLSYGTSTTPIMDNGVLKQGQIVMYITKGVGHTTTLKGYTNDGFIVKNLGYSATITSTNDAINKNMVTIKIINGICKWIGSTDQVMYESVQNITKLNGETTVFGNVNGKNRKGKDFSIEVTAADPIIKSCKYITSGKATFTKETKTHVIDYGYSEETNGCDKYARVTVGKLNKKYDMSNSDLNSAFTIMK